MCIKYGFIFNYLNLIKMHLTVGVIGILVPCEIKIFIYLPIVFTSIIP